MFSDFTSDVDLVSLSDETLLSMECLVSLLFLSTSLLFFSSSDESRRFATLESGFTDVHVSSFSALTGLPLLLGESLANPCCTFLGESLCSTNLAFLHDDFNAETFSFLAALSVSLSFCSISITTFLTTVVCLMEYFLAPPSFSLSSSSSLVLTSKSQVLMCVSKLSSVRYSLLHVGHLNGPLAPGLLLARLSALIF